MAYSRFILIGVDGATFDLLDGWMESDELPNFSSIADHGVKQPLETVVPTSSIPAWPSFNSGKNPGKHGLFAFNEDVKCDDDRLIDSRNLPTHRFWDVLAADGVIPGVVAGVQTYPPRELEVGFEVTGAQTPSDADVFTSPPKLSKEIRQKFPNYSFWPDISGDREDIQQACCRSIDHRAELSRYLMTEKKWDFFSVVFRSTDTAQHKLWNTPEMIYPVYERIDEFLGWIRSKYPDANIMLISDHGFTAPPEREFFLNTWLAERGDGDAGVKSNRKYALAKRVYSTVRQSTGINLRSVFPAAVKSWVTDSDKSEEARSIRSAKDTHFDGVVVSSGHEDYEVVRENIINELLSLEDPKTGKDVIQAAWKREELYSGEWLSEIPDIVILPHPEYNVNPNPYSKVFGKYSGMDNEGTHDAAPEGIFITAGPNITSTAITEGPSLLDVVPTMLYLCGTPIPEDFDGRVLTEIMIGEAADRPVETQDPLPFDLELSSEVKERAEVRERLADLGYL